jgi:hypothetical protein
MDARPLSKPLSPLGETVRAIRTWPDAELLQLARQVGYELIRRGQAVPVALPIGEAVASIGVTVPA